MPARTIESVEKKAALSTTTTATASSRSGFSVSPTPSTAASTSTTTPCTSARTPAANALPVDQRPARRGRRHQLGEDAGVALPDDLDAVEDRDEEHRLGQDSRREVVEVRHRGRDRVQVGERLAEDQQPERGLDGARVELLAVVAELLQLDQAQRGHAAARPPPGARRRPSQDVAGASQGGWRCAEFGERAACHLPLRACLRCGGGRRPRARRRRPART